MEIKEKKDIKTISLFKDYNTDGIYNGICAIEPEISKQNMDYIKKEYNTINSHDESSRIKEINNMHSISKEAKEFTIKYLTDNYSDKFPLGYNDELSGGVHFHLILNKELNDNGKYKGVSDMYPIIKTKHINSNMLGCPLYMKIYDNKFFSRRLSFNMFHNNSEFLGTSSRRDCVEYHTDFLPALEFRNNNVFDFRILGYYQAITIASLVDIKLTEVLTPVQGKGLSVSYNKLVNSNGDIPIKDIYDDGLLLSDNQTKTLYNNINILLSILQINGLIKSKKQLIDYLGEFLPDFKPNGLVYNNAEGKFIDEGSNVNILTLDNIDSLTYKVVLPGDLSYQTIRKHLGLFIGSKSSEKQFSPIKLTSSKIQKVIIKYKKNIKSGVKKKK